uniref:uncharacterized protein C1orf50 homolog isoform X2 n=1 Tax=Styela clava TaxID=7725 RepID=UPI00193AC430|nr:uncharacterized protein C1orf50 homolog isoform X2 [Styela clava]
MAEATQKSGQSAIVPVNSANFSGQAYLVEGSKPRNPEDLVNLARQIQQADSSVKAAAGSKLRAILDQMKMLQEQAARVLEEAKRDAELHHAACNFRKIPGKLYLYKRESGQTYFSMLSPEVFTIIILMQILCQIFMGTQNGLGYSQVVCVPAEFSTCEGASETNLIS